MNPVVRYRADGEMLVVCALERGFAAKDVATLLGCFRRARPFARFKVRQFKTKGETGGTVIEDRRLFGF